MRFSLFAFLPLALSCNIPAQSNSSTPLPFNITHGTDCPADPATTSYFINHVGFVVSNLTATREWYRKVLGMRHVFTVDLSSEYSLMYMAHSQAGRNGRGYQTGAELERDKNNLSGMVEFVWYKGATRKYTPGPRNTFSHFGLIVDDIAAAQARFESLNVTIVKRAGELDYSPETGSAVLASAYAFDNFESKKEQAAINAALPGLIGIGFGAFIMIADPDGNLFEVQALVPASL